MRVVSTEVVLEHRSFEANQALQVTLAVGGADKLHCDVVVITNFGTFRFALYELVMADVASNGIIIFFVRAGTQALYRPICHENRTDFRLLQNNRVNELG